MRRRLPERNAEILRQRKNNGSGNEPQVLGDPVGVGLVVVIGQLDEHRGGAGLPDFSNGGGAQGAHLARDGIDGGKGLGNEIRRLFALGAGGVIIDVAALNLTVEIGRRGIGMEARWRS